MARPVSCVAPLVALLLACGAPRPPAWRNPAAPPELRLAADRDARDRRTVRLEVDVPYCDLAFERDRTGFRSRLLLRLELLDDRGQPTGGDAWPFDLRAADYGATRSAARRFRQVVELGVPPGTRAAVGSLSVLGTTVQLVEQAELAGPSSAEVQLGRTGPGGNAASTRAE
jgi:hypothetical protein